MIKIAIIDSGIDDSAGIFKQHFIKGVGIIKDDAGNISLNDDYQDENGHGTLCASVICKECPQSEMLIIKIFQKEICTDINILERALEYLLNIDVQIVNMSISIDETENGTIRIEKLCKKLKRQGKLLVCAVTNGKIKSKPAIYNSVIGVRGSLLQNASDYWFSNIKKVNCIMDDIPYLHYKGKNDYSLFGMCNSYAAAKTSGMIAKIITSSPSKSTCFIRKKISKHAFRKIWSEDTIERSKRYPLFRDESIDYISSEMKKLEKILIQFFDLEMVSDLYVYALYSRKIGGGTWYYYPLAKVLEKEYTFKFESYNEISKYDFVSIFSIYKLIKVKLSW